MHATGSALPMSLMNLDGSEYCWGLQGPSRQLYRLMQSAFVV